MSRAVRLLLKNVLEYAQKKGGVEFAASLNSLFVAAKSCVSNDQIDEVKNEYLATINEMKFVDIKQKDDKVHLTVSNKIFRIYFANNDNNKLFLVVDYWSHNQHYYCYQLLSANIAITSFG